MSVHQLPAMPFPSGAATGSAQFPLSKNIATVPEQGFEPVTSGKCGPGQATSAQPPPGWCSESRVLKPPQCIWWDLGHLQSIVARLGTSCLAQTSLTRYYIMPFATPLYILVSVFQPLGASDGILTPNEASCNSQSAHNRRSALLQV